MVTKSTNRFPSLILLIFFFSGLSSLLYQVVWQRLLTVHYGVGATSITLIVSIYMAGLGIGALIGGFLAEQTERRIEIYFIIELMIGLFGLISLPFLNYLGKTTAGAPYAISAIFIVLFLIFPTTLMGMTLPLLTKLTNQWVKDFFHTVSFLYFVNALGAAVGALTGTFWLVSFFGMDVALYCAVGINLALAAGLLYFLFAKIPCPSTDSQPTLTGSASAEPLPFIGIWVFITGFLALGYEIVWTRILEVLVKSSPYAFSTMLAVYLFGIGWGSYRMDYFLRRFPRLNVRTWFFLLQFIIGAYTAILFIAFFHISKTNFLGEIVRTSFRAEYHPPLHMTFHSLIKAPFTSLDFILWPCIFILFPTLLMGASFPLSSLLALAEKNREGQTVGKIYSLNIVGNVLGGAVTGFLILPRLGTEISILIFSSVGILFGFILLPRLKIPSRPLWGFILCVFLILNIRFLPKKGQLYEVIHEKPNSTWTTYVEEGANGVVVMHKSGETIMNYINGLLHGGRGVAWMYSYYAEALQALAHAKSNDKVLVIGYGTGSIVEVALKSPEVKSLTLVELNRALLINLKKVPVFRELLSDPRINIVIDDGRRYLTANHDLYDLILMDPLRTRTAYSNNLYSFEFFTLLKSRLKPDGVIMVWLDEKKVIPKTILSVFKELRMYNYFCLASNNPMVINKKREEIVLSGFPPEVSDRFRHIAKYVGDQNDIAPTLTNTRINHDWKPRCEYYFGLSK